MKTIESLIWPPLNMNSVQILVTQSFNMTDRKDQKETESCLVQITDIKQIFNTFGLDNFSIASIPRWYLKGGNNLILSAILNLDAAN